MWFMSLNFGENFLDLISEAKKYFSQLDSSSSITLDEAEKSFFIDEINIVKPKPRSSTSRSSTPKNNTSKNLLEDNPSKKYIHPLPKQSLIKKQTIVCYNYIYS